MEDIWIKRVEISNFQSHKDTKIDFVKGTNALVGSSNSGKTAAIRAIRWCLINVPNGTEFITVGEKEAVVKVFLSNGKVIERRRNRTNVNLYVLYEGNEVLGEYTGFGSKVPQEIVEAHGITPIAGNLYFQFAHQLEAPFMLSLRPSKRAEILGDLEELSRIDEALSGINDDIRVNNKTKLSVEKEGKSLLLEQDKLTREAERLKEKVETLQILKKGIEEKLDLYTFIKSKLIRLKEIRKLLAETEESVEISNEIIAAWPPDLEDKVEQYKILRHHLDRLKEIKREINSISFMKEDKLEELAKMSSEIEEKIEKYNGIRRHVSRMKEIKQEQDKVNNSISPEIAEIDLEPLEKDISKYNAIYKHIEKMRQIKKNIKETENQINVSSQKVDEMLNTFVEALQKAEICPTCGQDTKGVCLEHVNTLI